MRKFKEISKIILVGAIIGTVLFFISAAFAMLSKRGFVFNKQALISFGYFQLYSIVLSFVNGFYFDYINNSVVWKKYKKYRIIIGALGGMLITIFTIFLLRLIMSVGINGVAYQKFLANEFNNNGQFYLIAILITAVISVIFHAIYYYRQAQKNKLTEQKVIAGTASAQFDALKNQLDPHFLFNSLNVLTSLIDENPDAAQNFTTSLSKVYRYVLEQKNKDLVTVDEELRFAKIYVGLLKMRFENSIVFDFPEKAINPEARVVPLSLQLLLENAVKHNVVTESKPLRIKIYEKDGQLIVENNLQVKQMIKKSSGVGLANIKNRYALLTKKQVVVAKDDERFSVTIPMLTKKLTIMETPSRINYDKQYIDARKRVQEMKDFYYSLTAYCIIIPFLIFVNYRTTWDYIHWFWFPLAGWGVGLTIHAYKVFINDGAFGRKWEKRKIEEFMKQEEKNDWH